MKIFVLSLMILFLSGTIWANAPAVDIASEIKSVTVYRSGAQVFRTGKSQVPAGQSILKFTDISPNVNPASVQFTATGDFTILSVAFQRNFINSLEVSEEAIALQARIDELEEQHRKLEIELEVLKEEEALILANKQLGGQQTGVQLQDLQAIAEYYRTRLRAIKLEQFDLRAAQQEINEEKTKLQQQLAEITRRGERIPSGEILVKVAANRSLTTNFELNYVVSQAGWKPSYDIRIADIGEAVKLTLKGDVFQSTGEDWRGVELNLSTGVPTQSGVKPSLLPWRLAPYDPVAYQQEVRERKMDHYGRNESAVANGDAEMAPPPPPPPVPAEYVAVEQFERTTTREYRISLPYDVPSDGKLYTVIMEDYALPADYQYYVAPKMDVEVFLTAKVSGWETYHLLSGPANLFFEGSYLGNTRVDVQQTTDTLEFSLGRDKGIIVKREKDEQFRDRQFIGNKVTQNIGWKIELRNNKSKAVSILVEDQFPISTTDELEVDLENVRGATVDRETGKLSWRVNLAPGEPEILRFRYEVKYPKRMQVSLE